MKSCMVVYLLHEYKAIGLPDSDVIALATFQTTEQKLQGPGGLTWERRGLDAIAMAQRGRGSDENSDERPARCFLTLSAV